MAVRDRVERTVDVEAGYGVTAAVCFAFAVLLLALQFAAFSYTAPLSGYDETGHVDYVVRLSDGGPPVSGDRYTQETLAIASCVGAVSTPPGSCADVVRDPQSRPPNGYSYEAIQPPLGYLPQALAWSLIDARIDSNAARIALLRGSNAAWALALAALLALLVPMVTRNVVIALAACTLVCTNPQVVNSLSYVTNDAAAAATGAGVLLLGLVFLRRQRLAMSGRDALLLCLAAVSGVVVALLKPTFLIACLALLLYGGLCARRRGRARTRVFMVLVGTQLVFGLMASAAYAWNLARASSIPSASVAEITMAFLKTDHFPFVDVVRSALGTLGAFLIADPYIAPWPYAALAASSGVVFLVTVFGRPGIHPTGRFDGRRLAVAVGITAPVFAVGVCLYAYASGGHALTSPVRYLIPLIPLAGLATTAVWGRFRWIAAGYVVSGVVVAALFSGGMEVTAANYVWLLSHL